MRVIEQLKQKFEQKLLLEANTTVTKVKYDPTEDQQRPYVVSTSRGDLRAIRVVYCTNGYTGRLVPGIKGRLFPYRGTMTVQKLANVPNRGSRYTWNLHHPPRYDSKLERVLDGEYYLQQNPKSGYLFFGGGLHTAETTFTTDDSVLETASVDNTRRVLPRYFVESQNSESELISAWSGIMGFTGDGFPLVGKLPGYLSENPNDGENEWIAAGFNGMGMCQGWRSGEAVANMILGQDVSDWLPSSFEISKERFDGPLTIDTSIKSMEFYLLQNDGTN
jgi:glycine/D-amino acid oxidase-like deaminating enzyme